MQDEVFRLKSNMTFLEFLSNSNMFGVQIPETVFHAPEFKKMIWPQNAYKLYETNTFIDFYFVGKSS